MSKRINQQRHDDAAEAQAPDIREKEQPPETPVLDFMRETKKRELEFLAQHSHKLLAHVLRRICLSEAYDELARQEFYGRDYHPSDTLDELPF